MTGAFTVRDADAADRAGLLRLYPAAFPDEDLVPLVRALLDEPEGVLSLLAEQRGKLAGHLVLTTCDVAGADASVALIGPLAVAPAHQLAGCGSTLVRAALTRAHLTGAARVLVFGDPAYYGRFGFQPERDIAPPYPPPGEWRDAWQSVAVAGGAARGTLVVPPPWRDPALWG